MPWLEAMLRGQRVLAKVKTDGAFDAEGGRVEIRYKPNDGRAYRAAAANLMRIEGAKLLPDETCVAGEPAAKKESPATKAKAKAESSAKAHAATEALALRTSTATDRWSAYTDGACSGNPGPAGSGMIVIAPGGTRHEGFEFLGNSTNNVAELTAILRAVESIPQSADEIVIHTDSKYSIGVLTKGWKAKVNQDLIAKAKLLVAARRAKLVYVPAHSGVELNERADALAREAIVSRSTRRIPL